MKPSQACVDFVKQFEGFSAHAYKDGGGVLTIGYGHTGRAGPPAVVPGLRMSEAEARTLINA